MPADRLFAQKILLWYAREGRELPWRGTHDAYAVWLSEIILQQTRVQQGWEYWERFMRRWPTVGQLADASEDEVLREWQGLGYYSRARNLHAAARQIVAQGHFPDTLEGIKALKGVGDYTAAAISSIAFGLPVAAVDGNVYRVLARHFGIDVPVDTTAGKRLFAELAQSLLPPAQAADFNQGMMDFGAMQCTPTRPRCADCPLASTCWALSHNQADRLPAKQPKTQAKTRRLTYFYVRHQGCVAIHRRAGGDIWQGLWEPLVVEGDAPMPHFDGQLTLVAEDMKHVLTHRILLANCFLVEAQTKPQLPDGYAWVEEEQLDRHALPRLVEKLVELVQKRRQEQT